MKPLTKKIILLVLVFVSIILLNSCSLFSNTNNNITNKTVEYTPFDISSFQDSLIVATEKAEQSVVSVYHSEGTITQSSTLGSGVIVNRIANLKNESLGEVDNNIINYRYFVVTNRHVIIANRYSGASSKLKINYKNHEYDAKCERFENDYDLAILSFTSTEYIVECDFADSSKLKRGMIVLAIGSPYSLLYYGSVTMGIISYPDRILDDSVYSSNEVVTNIYIQHDAAINVGNSGGGLFDINGNLIGINTAKLTNSSDFIENMGFAIPINKVIEIYKLYLTK